MKEGEELDYMYEFFDPSDIAEDNRNIVFTPAEQAILISMNHTQTIDKKIRALQYLVDTYPDEAFHTRAVIQSMVLDRLENSLREAVRHKIKVWQSVLENRFNSDGVIFVAVLDEGGFPSSDFSHAAYFTDYDKAYAYLQREKQEYTDDELLRNVILHARILRIRTDTDGWRMGEETYFFDHDLELVYVYECPEEYRTEEGNIIPDISEDFCVYVPIPFKKGDLVKEVLPSFQVNYGILRGDYGEADWERRKQIGFGDSEDMCVCLDVCDEMYGSWDHHAHVYRLRLHSCTREEKKIPVPGG